MLGILFATFLLSAGLTTLALRWWSSPVARLRRAIRRQFPGSNLEVYRRNALRVNDGDREVVVPATRVLRVAQAESGRLEAEIEHALAEIGRALRWQDLGGHAPDEIDWIVPVPLPAVRTEAVGENARYCVSITPDIDIGFAVGGPASGRWVTEGDRLRRGLTSADLLDRGLARLRQSTDGATILQEGSPGTEIFMLRQGDDLDAARLLLADMWERVADYCGQPLVLCTPTRDRIYAAPLHQPASIDRMVEHVAADWVSRPHAVSPRIWIHEEGRLRAWSTHA